MNNTNYSLLESFDENELFYNVATIINILNSENPQLDNLQSKIKNEIDIRLGKNNIIFPWNKPEEIKKYPFATLLYQLGLLINNMSSFQTSLTGHDIDNIFYNKVHIDSNKGYVCMCGTINLNKMIKYISEEYPGYSVIYKPYGTQYIISIHKD